MPRILDLFCGAGGAAAGYAAAGFEVVGVDLHPQPRYPFTFHQGDALDAVIDFNTGFFDAIHASPPCQRWSFKSARDNDHEDLITPLRPLLEATGLPFVIENVQEAPLISPVVLCGSSFGLDVQRHRSFETNWPLSGLPCIHEWQLPRFDLYDHGKWYRSGVVHVFGTGGGKGKAHWNRAMGIDWMTRKEIVEAIPPAYTHFVGLQLKARLDAASISRFPIAPADQPC